MLIGQLTDIHIGFDRSTPREANLIRLERTLAHIDALPTRPDMLLLSGDLTEHGDLESYRILFAALASSGIEAWPIPGNHDCRDALLAADPRLRPDGPYIHYAIERDDMRILMLDTLEPGRHGGALCADRARWLDRTLAARPDTATLIVMHHPPYPAGIPWMDTDPAEPWVARFEAAIAPHAQVRTIAAGHVHRTSITDWHGRTCLTCPSTAPAVAFDTSVMSTDPDARALIVEEPPGYALHRWDGAGLVSHVMTALPAPILASYTQALAPMISGMLAERP